MTRKSSGSGGSKTSPPHGFLRRHWAWLAAGLAGLGLLFTVALFFSREVRDMAPGVLPEVLPDSGLSARPGGQPGVRPEADAGSGPGADAVARPQSSAPSSPPRQDAAQDSQPYEEDAVPGFEEELKRIDYALLLTLRSLGLGPESYSLTEVSHHHEDDLDYLVQSIFIQHAQGASHFASALSENLERWAPNATVGRVDNGLVHIALLGRETHTLRFAPSSGPPPRPRPAGSGVLAIVIDDLGENVAFAEALARLPYPVTFAVWPQSSHARAVAQIAKKYGRDVIIHQPMEPDNYPRINPGPGVVLTRMSDAEIVRMLKKNIALVPEAVGMNNHMGSRFTGSLRGMRLVMSVLKEQGLFFLDSRTNSRSVAKAAAGEFDVPFAGRHVFLDNIVEEGAIIHQLQKAENMALRQGVAVAIGHPHSATLAALRRFANEAAPGLRMVSVVGLTRNVAGTATAATR